MITYSYGALRPIEGFELLTEQLKLANRYRNQLIEIELWRRAASDYATKEELKLHVSTATRAARAASGLGWGTYQLVEDDVARASKTATPRFRPTLGLGRVGAAVQACSELDEKLGGPVVITGPDHKKHAVARLRVTKD